jgi:hypothetical protein
MPILLIVVIAAASGSVCAQWFKVPSPRAPRTATGEVDLAAPPPRLANGKPDLSGVWMTAEPLCVIRGTAPDQRASEVNPPSRQCPPRTASFSRQSINIGIDMPGGLPYQSWLATLVEERTANQAIDDPHIRCLPDFFLRAYGLPHYLKFVQTPDLLVMLNEYNGTYRRSSRRSSAAGGPESLVAGLFDGHLVRRHAGHRHHRISRRPVDRLGRQHDHRRRKDS